MAQLYPYISGINYESVTDGPGVRTAIFLSGCSHNCPGCHNPETHNPICGRLIDQNLIEEIACNVDKRPYINGITLTGGDPLFDVKRTLEFTLKLILVLNNENAFKNIWLYTGYTWEEIVQRMKTDEDLQSLISVIDVIVDGPFIKELADKRLDFRGSSNQRLIDVKSSLGQEKPVLWKNTAREV